MAFTWMYGNSLNLQHLTNIDNMSRPLKITLVICVFYATKLMKFSHTFVYSWRLLWKKRSNRISIASYLMVVETTSLMSSKNSSKGYEYCLQVYLLVYAIMERRGRDTSLEHQVCACIAWSANQTMLKGNICIFMGYLIE